MSSEARRRVSPRLNAFQPREWTEYMCRVVEDIYLCDVWILLMLLSNHDIIFTVVVELGGKNGDAVQHRLNVTLTELATH